MIKDLKLGYSVSHPREVTERVNLHNEQGQADARQAGDIGYNKIKTYDLKDFFTNIPREEFVEALREGIRQMQMRDRYLKWF